MIILSPHNDRDLAQAIEFSKTLKLHNDIKVCVNGEVPNYAKQYFDYIEDISGAKKMPCNCLCIAPFDKITKKVTSNTKEEDSIDKLTGGKSIIIFDNLEHPKFIRLYKRIVKDARSNR